MELNLFLLPCRCAYDPLIVLILWRWSLDCFQFILHPFFTTTLASFFFTIWLQWWELLTLKKMLEISKKLLVMLIKKMFLCHLKWLLNFPTASSSSYSISWNFLSNLQCTLLLFFCLSSLLANWCWKFSVIWIFKWIFHLVLHNRRKLKMLVYLVSHYFSK